MTAMLCLGLFPKHQWVFSPDRAYCERKKCRAVKPSVRDRTPHEIRMYDQFIIQKQKEHRVAAAQAIAKKQKAYKKAKKELYVETLKYEHIQKEKEETLKKKAVVICGNRTFVPELGQHRFCTLIIGLATNPNHDMPDQDNKIKPHRSGEWTWSAPYPTIGPEMESGAYYSIHDKEFDAD